MILQDYEDKIKELLQLLVDNKKIDYLGMSVEDFGDFIEMLEHDDLIQGAKITRGGRGNKILMVFTDTIRITLSGVRYLSGRITRSDIEKIKNEPVEQSNSNVKKTKNLGGEEEITYVERIEMKFLLANVDDIDNMPDSLSDKRTEIDYLGYNNIVKVFSKFISSTKTEMPMSFGLFGDWGRGKSSFIHIMKNQFMKIKPDEDYEKVQSIDFNAWEYPEKEDIWFGMLQKITNDFLKKRNFRERIFYNFKVNYGIKKLIWRFILIVISLVSTCFLFKVDGIEKILTAIGFDSNLLNQTMSIATLIALYKVNEDILKRIVGSIRKSKLKTMRNIFSFKDYKTNINKLDSINNDLKNISDFLEQKNERLVIFIDDLDRCTHDKIIKIMESTHLFLNVNRIFIVYALDYRITRMAIENMFKNEYGEILKKDKHCIEELINEYLEKFIQIPYFLKPVSDSSIDMYIDYLFLNRKDIKGAKAITSYINPMQGEEEEEQEQEENNEIIYYQFNNVELIEFKEAIKLYDKRNPRDIKKMRNLLLLSKSLFFNKSIGNEDFIIYIGWFVFNYYNTTEADSIVKLLPLIPKLNLSNTLQDYSEMNYNDSSIDFDVNGVSRHIALKDCFSMVENKVFSKMTLLQMFSNYNLANHFISQND